MGIKSCGIDHPGVSDVQIIPQFLERDRPRCYRLFMSTSKEDLYRLALELTDAERAALAGMLLDSLEPGEDPEVESAWLAEVEELRARPSGQFILRLYREERTPRAG